MTLFQRAHDIVQAKANKALDAAEKPDEMLDLSYEKMLEQITQVRRGLVDIAASRKQIELQEQQLQHSVDHLQDQAKAALAQGREDLAKEALARKATAQQQIDEMEPQHEQLVEEEQKLDQTLDALQKRVNDFRTQKEALKAQYTAAQAVSTVDESAAGISKSFNDSGPSSSGLRTRSPPCRPGPAPSTSCSSPACSRTSGVAPTTSRRSSTRSGRTPGSTTSWPRSRPRSARAVPRRKSPGALEADARRQLRGPSARPSCGRPPVSQRAPAGPAPAGSVRAGPGPVDPVPSSPVPLLWRGPPAPLRKRR